MAKLHSITHHYRNSLAVRLLELGMDVDIDDFDIGVHLLADRPERGQEIVAEMAPGPAIDGQVRP